MTPLTIAEQSFLKLDAPQQAKPAATKGASGAGFGNVMAEAREKAPAETKTAKSSESADHAPDTAEKKVVANSDSAPAKNTAQTAEAEAAPADTADSQLPVIARLPKGGLSNHAATSETAITRMTVKAAADGGSTVAAASTPAKAVTKGDIASADLANASDTAPAEVTLLQTVASTTEQPAEGKAAIAASEGATDVAETAQVVPEQTEKLRTLNASTSPAALTAQHTATAETEAPATTHASLSLRAKISAKPAKSQAEAEVVAKPVVAEGDAPASAKTEIKSPEATDAPIDLKAAQGDAKALIKGQPEQTAEVPTQDTEGTTTTDPTAVAAAVAAPVAARQSSNAEPVARQPKAAQALSGERQAKAATTRPDAQAAMPQTAQPAVSQRGAKTVEADAKAPGTSSKAIGAEAKPSLTVSGFEQAMQQAATTDAGVDLTEALTKPVDLPQQTALPQQPLAAAPQVQVTAAPDAFQQLETAARDVASTELAMDQAEWPENLIETIGFETLADGEAMDIQLTPENLGRVQLRMELRDGAASIMIVTETSEAAKQFNDNQQKLADLLAKQGVELANHNASMGRDTGSNNQGGQTGSAQGTNSQSDGPNGAAEAETITARKDPNRLVDVQA